MKVKGGHAIMLKVELSQDIKEVAEAWVASRSEFRKLALDDAHITVIFIGRDLDENTHDAILEVTKSAMKFVPPIVTFQGRFAMFGGRRDHLVALVVPDDRLSYLRKIMCDRLRDSGVTPMLSYGYTPHITLATGLPGDGCTNTALMRASVEINEVSVKLGKRYVSLDARQMEKSA
jgi:2'-5' RNA ligase